MNAIEIRNLSKTYRGKSFRKVQALTDLCLDVERGEVFGFLGPNGAGKSTTIKFLMGLVKSTSGEAFISGESVRSHKARMRVGYLPENPAFYDFLNAVEYLQFTGRIYGLSGRQLQDGIDKVLHQLDIWEARKRPIRSYSKGMVQRLGLAQTLLHDPEVYILDEPMSGLDPLGRALVKDLILGLRQAGKTVFFSTHITADVERVCDKVGIICQGEIQALAGVRDIQKEGIDGYIVHLIDQVGSEEQEYIPVDLLEERLKQIVDGNKKIQLIEPRRTNLENFFLKVINQGN